MLSTQRTSTEPELKQDVMDNSSFIRPQCITPDPTAARRSTDEDHGNSKVSRGDARQVPFLDKEKNIAFLLKELDSLRELNKKLQEKLALKEKELETIRLDSQFQEEKLEAHACERAAALVEQIYKAQRERDEAVMARLRLANEERDEALLRAKKLQEAALELEDINTEESDMELEKLLNMVSIADSALTIERSGMAIMQRIQKARERRFQITSEEMKTVIEERDKAITRCKRLEQQLYHTRDLGQTSSICPSTQSGSQEQGRKIQLDFSAVQNTVGQKSEEDPLSLCSTLQDKTDDSVKKEMSSTTAQSLISRVQQLSSDLQATQTRLLLAQESEKEATEKVHKLERLVEVLRKKVGTGSVRTVI